MLMFDNASPPANDAVNCHFTEVASVATEVWSDAERINTTCARCHGCWVIVNAPTPGFKGFLVRPSMITYVRE